MQPDRKRIVQHEIISPTMVLISVRPEDGAGSAVVVSHKDAEAFARSLIADLKPAEAARA